MEKNLLYKKKKAQMHTEIILSFTLFISAILVIFFFLNPLINTDNNKIDINFIESSLLKNVSVPIGMMSVITEFDNGCYNLNSNFTNLYGTEFTEYKVPGVRKYILYFGEFLNNQPSVNNDINCATEYNFGLYLIEDITFYGEIENLVIAYDLNYDSVKSRLNIKNDFTFKFKENNGTEIMALTPKQINIPKVEDVNAKEFPIIIINENGEIKEVILNIRAW